MERPEVKEHGQHSSAVHTGVYAGLEREHPSKWTHSSKWTQNTTYLLWLVPRVAGLEELSVLVLVPLTLQQCSANMGSTDVWRPLHSLHLLSDHAPNVGGTDTSTLPPRSVFLVSDGHVTEETPTLDVIRRGVKKSRLFTFGVE